MKTIDRKVSVAPMMDYTDKHCRYFLRLLTQQTLLYTEMITADAVIHGDQEKLLGYHPAEHPLALQLGGSDPTKLAQSAIIAEQLGYDEVNLNVGCPSDRVQAGRFGACLMKEPELVADCFSAMQEQVKIPVTIKTRLGVDDFDSYEFLQTFIATIANHGCNIFILHARKAWLKGLSPKENRNVPPLNYESVYQLKKDFPDLNISINGGIKTIQEIKDHLLNVDGVMLGRAAYHNSFLLSGIDETIYKNNAIQKTRRQVLEDFIPYVMEKTKEKIPLTRMTKHILGISHGVPNSAKWRQFIATELRNANENELQMYLHKAMNLLNI